ncbi:MAG: glycosyltransferase family 4 protein [Candidatus Woesearchaeota archaeon]
MRILMLNYEFPPLGGGASNACYYMLKEFSKMNIEIDLVTAGNGSVEKFSKNITIYKIKVKKKSLHYWKASELLLWSLRANKKVKELISKNKYSLCHSWFGWPTGVIAYFSKLPYIIALRGSDVPGYNVRLKWLDKFIFSPISKLVWKNAKCVTANSKGLKELALKTLKCDIKVIYNGVDVKEFKPSTKKGFTLISTGRLITRKGYQYLIPALPPNVKLQLIGEGNLLPELKKLNGNVEFLGKVKHSSIPKYLSKASVFVLPSLNEGMSNSVLEAMACGLPVIVTDVGGSAELVSDNGFIVKKGSVTSLRNAIEKFLKDPSLIEKMGKNSRELALKMTWNKVAKEYVKVYG